MRKELWIMTVSQFYFGNTWHGTPAVYLSGAITGTDDYREVGFTVPDRGPGRHRFHEFIRGMRTGINFEELFKAKDYEQVCRKLTEWAQMNNAVLMFEETEDNGYPRYNILGVYTNADGGVINYGWKRTA